MKTKRLHQMTSAALAFIYSIGRNCFSVTPERLELSTQ